MKNTNKDELKKAFLDIVRRNGDKSQNAASVTYVLTMDEFEELCKTIYGPETEVIFDNNGITIETNNEQDDMFENDELANELSKQLTLNIVSVHITETDDNVYIVTK